MPGSCLRNSSRALTAARVAKNPDDLNHNNPAHLPAIIWFQCQASLRYRSLFHGGWL
jgi:hypothetical protein